jgi:hypothetical protein
MHDRLGIVKERIKAEFDRLPWRHVGPALHGLVATRLAKVHPGVPCPEPTRYTTTRTPPTIAVEKTSPELAGCGLVHDIGKPATRSWRASFHHHEVVGARMTQHG